MTWLALALCLPAWAFLCLAMDRHWSQVYGARARRPRRPGIGSGRALGWITLVASFALAVLADGWTHGPLYWLGGLTAAGIAVGVWLLPYWPRALVHAAWLLPLVAVCGWVLGG